MHAYFPKIAWHKSWQKYMIMKKEKKKEKERERERE